MTYKTNLKAINMKTFLILILYISLLSLQGCDAKTSTTELESKVKELSAKLDATQSELDLLKKETSKVSMNDMFRDWESIAFINTGSTSFEPIKTMIGTITVNIADVQPFANGSKVKLVFGNPHSANLASVKFTIDYGSLTKEGVVKDGTEKSKEISLPDTLYAGSWASAPVVLEGLPVSELGYVRIHDLSIASISLRGTIK